MDMDLCFEDFESSVGHIAWQREDYRIGEHLVNLSSPSNLKKLMRKRGWYVERREVRSDQMGVETLISRCCAANT